MSMRILSVTILFVILSLNISQAQDTPDYYQLDPKAYDPKVDVNPDLFIADWRNSLPRAEHGSLIVRDIFTRHTGDDPLKPETAGAVLNVFTEYAYGTLAGNTSTTPGTLTGEQKIFYFLDGYGVVRAGDKSADIGPYFAVLIPEGIEFSITNTGRDQLTMLIVGEPTYRGFKPLDQMVVKDENNLPIAGTTGHWVNINKSLFSRNQGLATIVGMSPVWLDPMTMAQPHASRGLGTDVLWFAIEGDIHSLIGKKFYKMRPGMAYKNPSDGKFYHANVNVTDKLIKLLWVRSISPEAFSKLGK